MKFDFSIGNPPYQEEAERTSATNGQAPRKNIFHYFQMEADKISDQSVLIYPGGRWLHRSGKGLQQFGKTQINDPRLSLVEFYPHAKEIFGNAADLGDGVTIVAKRKNKTTGGFKYIYREKETCTDVNLANPGDDLIPLNPRDIIITEKIRKFAVERQLPFLHEAVLPRTLFGIESDFVYKHKNQPDKVRLLTDDANFDPTQEVKVLTNDKPGKAGRAKWHIVKRNLIKHNAHLIKEYQVVVSSANAGGQKRSNQIQIIDNQSAFGRVRVALRSFKTQAEAKNFYKYAQTYIVRFAFLMTDEALSSLALAVPDLVNYQANNAILNFAKDIDEQMFKMCKLTEDEIAYIKNKIDTLR